MTINAVASALEHDADNVREVLLEAGAKNPRIAAIEGDARRLQLRVEAHEALENADLNKDGQVAGPPRKTFAQAATQIVIADVSMSLDNVLAVAGAALRRINALADLRA